MLEDKKIMDKTQSLDAPKRKEWKWLAWLLIIITLLYSILPIINIIKILTGK